MMRNPANASVSDDIPVGPFATASSESASRRSSQANRTDQSENKRTSRRTRLEKASICDVPAMLELIDTASKNGHLLPRSLSYLYDNVRDFWVAKRGLDVVGCGSLHICWDNLAEVKSLVVKEEFRGKGIGTRIVQACVREAIAFGIGTLFVLTYVPAFFQRLEFVYVDKASLPHKIWQECINCPKFPHCEEVALVRRTDLP